MDRGLETLFLVPKSDEKQSVKQWTSHVVVMYQTKFVKEEDPKDKVSYRVVSECEFLKYSGDSGENGDNKCMSIVIMEVLIRLSLSFGPTKVT